MKLRSLFACLLAAGCPGATYTVCAHGCQSADLQASLHAAKPGDTLVLNAGEVYKGAFYLPWKDGDGYVTIQSSKVAQLPAPGYRVTPAHAPLMAVLQQGSRGIPALVAGANEYEVQSVDLAGNRLQFGWHQLVNGEAIACRAAALPAPLEQRKVYYVRDVVQYTLRLSATRGGSPLQLTNASAARMRCSQAGTAHHYRVRGLEIRTFEGAPAEYALVSIGSGAELNRFSVPHHIELNQVYIHGRSTRKSMTEDGPRICLVLNGAHVSVRDSYISECKKEGEEAKGILAWQAPGPVEIRNNYIEGASLNILLGGAAPAIPDHVVGDGDGTGEGGGVVITGNHLSKQLYWKYQTGPGAPGPVAGACQEDTFHLDIAVGRLYVCRHDGTSWRWDVAPECSDGEYFRRTNAPENCAGGACWVCRNRYFERVDGPYRGGSYVIKGVVETKSMMNGVITGNVLEKSASTPVSLPMQVTNEGYNWNRVENALFQNNIVRDSSSGYHNGTEGQNRFTKPNRNVRIANNLFHHIGMTETPTLQYPLARPAFFQGPCFNCSFAHNTLLADLPLSHGILLGREPLAGFSFTDNILYANAYGVSGDGQGQDCDAIEYYAGRGAFRNNVFINNGSRVMNGSVGRCAEKTKYVAANTALFVGEGNYRLKPTSPYSASCRGKCDYTATDGKDVGADIDEVEAATSGAVAGTPPWAAEIQLSVTPAARQAVFTYQQPEDGECSLRVYASAARKAALHEAAAAEAGPAGGRQRRFQVPLAPQTDYWYLLQCRHRRIPGQLRTTAP